MAHIRLMHIANSNFTLHKNSMELLRSKYQQRAVCFGVIFLITYFLADTAFSFLLCIFAGLVFLIVCFLGLYKQDKGEIGILCLVAGIVMIAKVLKSEIFKSQKVLEAVLKN